MSARSSTQWIAWTVAAGHFGISPFTSNSMVFIERNGWRVCRTAWRINASVKIYEIILLNPWLQAFSLLLTQQFSCFCWLMLSAQCSPRTHRGPLPSWNPKIEQVYGQFIQSCWMKMETWPKKNCLLFAFQTKYNQHMRAEPWIIFTISARLNIYLLIIKKAEFPALPHARRCSSLWRPILATEQNYTRAIHLAHRHWCSWLHHNHDRTAPSIKSA